MPHDSIFHRYCLNLGLLLTSIACAIGCASDESSGLSEIRAQREAVPLKKFLQLEADMPKSEVERLLGVEGEHQFSYLDDDGHTYHLNLYEVAPDLESEFRSLFDLLFKDNALLAVLDIHDESDHFRTLHTNASTSAPQEFDNKDDIEEFFRVESMRGKDIVGSRDELKRRIQSEEKEWKAAIERGDSNSVQSAMAAAGIVNSKASRREYEINKQHLKLFDPHKIAIGMTTDEVNSIFGSPRYHQEIDKVLSVGLYGPDQFRTVNPNVVCSPVMVLFRDGRVVRVLSHRLFDRDWGDEYIGGK